MSVKKEERWVEKAIHFNWLICSYFEYLMTANCIDLSRDNLICNGDKKREFALVSPQAKSNLFDFHRSRFMCSSTVWISVLLINFHFALFVRHLWFIQPFTIVIISFRSINIPIKWDKKAIVSSLLSPYVYWPIYFEIVCKFFKCKFSLINLCKFLNVFVSQNLFIPFR